MSSFSYHFVRFIIKLKGLKKIFSQDPMPYAQLRKDDVYTPSKWPLKGCEARPFNILDSTITAINAPTAKHGDYLLLHCPGGAFVSGPNATAWDTVVSLAKRTGITVWVVNYPKAPEYKLSDVATNLDAIYQEARTQYAPEKILLMGDSAGGHIILTLLLRLLEKGQPLPQQLITICPVVEFGLTNPAIAAIDPLDPMLSTVGIRSANRFALGELSIEDPQVSPLYGNFEGAPPITFFLAEHDVLYPDGLLLAEKMRAAGIAVDIIIGKGMLHVWPVLPFMKEARVALGQIEALIARAIG